MLALMNKAFAGYQGAMMVPTEVLARQQYESIRNMFANAGIDINVGLLTGSMTQSARRKVYDDIKNGTIDIVVGTHALIQEKVEYNNLALVITDEQHRFGVALITIICGLFPLSDNCFLWLTPNLCCSSVITSARLLYSTFS